MTQNDVFVIGSTQFNLGILGASIFPTVFKSGVGSVGGQIRVTAVGTSSLLQIYPQALSSGTVSGATAVLAGYPLGASQVFEWLGPASFYIASTGSTTTVAALFYYSAGATLV